MAKVKRIKCPKCGNAWDDELDWWIDAEGYWHWNCFDCGHEWLIHQSKMKDLTKKKKVK